MNIPSEDKVSSIRKYFIEYTVMFLVACVVTLFGLYYNLNKFVTETLIQDKIKAEQVIEKNTEALYFLTNKNK